MSDFVYPIKEEYMKVVLEGNLNYKLFVTNTDILKDPTINSDCMDWLEENIGKIWIDWGWPTARMPSDPDDPDRWVLMLFKNETDALQFKLIWG